MFNLDRIRWLKIDDMVQAARIASGYPAPIEYYEALTEDRESASNALGLSLLSTMMRG